MSSMVSERSMQSTLHALVQKLDRKIDLDWVEEMRLGKPAYDHLIACARAKTLTRHQLTNALLCLFRLRCHGNEEEVLALFRDHASHREIRVRSKAVVLTIGMMRMHHFATPFDLGASINQIKAGIALGLYTPVASYASDILKQHS